MRHLSCVVAIALLAFTTPVLGVTKEYKKKAKEWREQHTRSDFFREVNKDRDVPITGPRADRLWAYLEEQFDHGAVVFKDNGIAYSLPLTHFIPLPDFFVDLIEAGMRPLRKVYYFAMEMISESAHETHHIYVEWLNEKGVVTVLVGFCIAYISWSVLMWFVNRFTDGIWPSERRLNKHTKKLASDYMAKKRQ
jgi:hypothetical protein